MEWLPTLFKIKEKSPQHFIKKHPMRCVPKNKKQNSMALHAMEPWIASYAMKVPNGSASCKA
jgi:hypothetical protein